MKAFSARKVEKNAADIDTVLKESRKNAADIENSEQNMKFCDYQNLCVARIDFPARASLFLSLFEFEFLFSGGPSRRSRQWDLTDVPRTTYTHDTVGNPEDIALGKKNHD